MVDLIDGFKGMVSKEELLDLLEKQLSNFFFLTEYEKKVLYETFDDVLIRTFNCFKGIDNKYFQRDGCIYFSPYHSGQYLIFLYYYANSIFKCLGNTELCDKLYYLNKLLNSCDIYYEVELPEIFFLEHPVGTVLGRGKYGNNFFAMQSCTIGGNKGAYPIIGDSVRMYSGSKVLGNSVLGDNVTLSANTYVKDTNIPAGATVFGMSPNLTIKYLKNK